jgi:hypothetical protein
VIIVANLLASALFILILVLSLYGWGRVLLRQLLPNSNCGWAFKATFGLSLWIFFGGILNLFTIANSLALWGIMLLGLFFYLYYIKSYVADACVGKGVSFKQILEKLKKQPSWLGQSLLYLLIFTLLLFYISTLMPTPIFNPYDDFLVYLSRPLQMLSSGTLNTDSPFSLLPLDSLGGQAFMQSFFVMIFNVEYINGFDAVLCFALSIAMIVEIGKKLKATFEIILLAITVFVMWHPVYMNTSAIYSSSLLILGAVYSLIVFYKSNKPTPSIINNIKVQIVFAFFVAAIITLKSTIAIFVIMFFLVNFMFGLIFVKDKIAFVQASIISFIMAIVLIIPWLLVHAEKISTVYQSFIATGYSATFAFKKGSLGVLLIFNYLELFWGGRLYWFLLLFVFFAVIISFSLFLLWKNKNEENPDIWSVPLISLCITSALFYFLSPLAFSWGHSIQHTVRHTIPGLLAGVAMLPILLYSISCLASSKSKLLAKSLISAPNIKTILVPSAQVVLLLYIGMFVVLFVDRMERLDLHKSNISSLHWMAKEGWIPNVLALNSQAQRDEIKKIQEIIPKQEKILVWISTPFLLDFARNKIDTINSLDPLFKKGFGNDSGLFLQDLKKREVKYIFWQYGGIFMKDRQKFKSDVKHYHPKKRNEGQMGLFLLDIFEAMKNNGEIIYSNDTNKLVLFKINYNP